jgi:hypothetical protein
MVRTSTSIATVKVCLDWEWLLLVHFRVVAWCNWFSIMMKSRTDEFVSHVSVQADRKFFGITKVILLWDRISIAKPMPIMSTTPLIITRLLPG